MAFRLVAANFSDSAAGEAEMTFFARVPERIKDQDGRRVNMAATVDDPRNWHGEGWRGMHGIRVQAVLKCLFRQWNDQPKSTKTTFWAKGPVSLKKIQDETGYHRQTIIGALDDLHRRGIIAVEVDKPGTKDALYFAGLILPVSGWNLPQIHVWQEQRPSRYCPF